MLHGAYHVAWENPGTTAEKIAAQMRDLRTVAGAGMNLFHTSHLEDIAATRRLLNTARTLGVLVILEDVNPSERAAFLGHPALLALNVADDANRLQTPQTLAAETQVPGARYMSIGVTDDGAEWTYGHSEVIGLQTYPYPYEQLAYYWPKLIQARELADKHGQRLYANLQAHHNNHRDKETGELAYPKAEQIRALAWLSAAAGVDGVLWFAQVWKGGRMPPAVWQAVRAVTLEMRRVTVGRPAVTLDGERLTAVWPGGGRVVIDLTENRVLSVEARLENK